MPALVPPTPGTAFECPCCTNSGTASCSDLLVSTKQVSSHRLPLSLKPALPYLHTTAPGLPRTHICSVS